MQTKSIGRIWFFILLIAGSLIRILLSLRGHNFDVDSYRIVADIVSSGGNVYSLTSRYNYGPIWFHVLGLLDNLFAWIESDLSRIRLAVTCFLTGVDILMAIYISHKYSRQTALLFFLNPISIIISGYHSQFDNLAVLTGLVAVDLYERSGAFWPKTFSLSLLGLSLSIKHVFILFPLWIFFREKKIVDKTWALLIPIIIFILLFAPYAHEGLSGIISNVFKYESLNNAPLWSVIAPNFLFKLVPVKAYRIFFLVAIALLGFMLRKRSLSDTSYIYLISFVALSSAIANQYLSICVPGIAVNWNFLFAVYTVVGSLFLAVDGNGLHIASISEAIGWNGQYAYNILSLILTCGLIYGLAGKSRSMYIFRAALIGGISLIKRGI